MSSTVFIDERLTIEEIRRNNPTVPQMTLAKRIQSGEFNTTDSHPGDRSLLSTYSVIRRYDARQTA